MNTVAELLDHISQLKKRPEKFYTNLYVLPSQLENLIFKKNIQVFIKDHIIVIMEKEPSFFRLYY